jgi:beta-glucosidase
MSRRDFGRFAGSVAATSLITSPSQAATTAAPEVRSGFPATFLWGTATASYQVEGAVHRDGRGLSIWDTFSHTPGKVSSNNNGDVADDEFDRFAEDIQIMSELGIRAFRFSVSWSRIYPEGTGAPNPQGMTYYNRLVDSLLRAGITPFCTVYHWDLPQALQARGGWQNRDTALRLADYAGYVSSQLSDRVKHFFTMNEIRTFTELGYGSGIHAPGLQLDRKDLAQVEHHALLGHGMAVQSIRSHAKAPVEVGIAENPAAATPVTDQPEQIDAARKAMREENAMFLTAILEGVYTPSYLRRMGADAPRFTPEEMKTINEPLDFVGLNIYQPTYVRSRDNEQGYEVVQFSPTFPHMASQWLTIGPESMYWAPRFAQDLWKLKAIYITENGASAEDELNADGEILDIDRVMYLRNYIDQLRGAVSAGVPVKGYFLWSLLDNFEWADGYGKRFGIVYVDFETQKRTPKLSAAFYSSLIRA